MTVHNRSPVSSEAALRAAEALRRQAEAQEKPKASIPRSRGSGQSFFEEKVASRKLDLSGEGARAAPYFQTAQVSFTPTPTLTPERTGLTPLTPRGTATGISVGTVSHQEGTVYSDNVTAVLDETIPGANYCASTAFDGLAEALPGWASEAGIEAVLREHGTGSSIALWNQLFDAFTGAEPPISLTPEPGHITEVALPDGQPLHVELTVDGQTLGFQATEVELRNNTPSLTPENTSSTLETLGDMAVGETRAVLMRPLNHDGSSATTSVGHWVLVERTQEGYRLTQSAPEDWALLGGSAGTPNGGLYVHEFSGDTALEDVSRYLHAEANYSAGSAGMYGIVVLEPVTSE